MTPEEIARQQIDMILGRCGWTVQDKSEMNLHATKGVALRELSFKTGEPDYTLFVDGKAIATVEAKPEGHSLTGVEEQSTKYVTGLQLASPSAEQERRLSVVEELSGLGIANLQRATRLRQSVLQRAFEGEL